MNRMKRFCIHCGEEVSKEHKICIHCGKPLPDSEEPETDDSVDAEDETPKQDERDDQLEAEDSTTPPAVTDTENSEVSAHDETDEPADETTAEEKIALGVAAEESTGEAEVIDDTRSETKEKGKPWLKRILWIVIALLIIFVIWAKNYASLESVEKRFHKALENEDSSALTNLMIHNDESALKTFEAEAFIDLYNKRGQTIIHDLTMTIESGKFLFLFDTYKIEANDQIPYDEAIEGLTYTFNGQELDIYDQDEHEVAFGPVAPGIYEVEAIVDSDFGEFTTTEEVTLDNSAYEEYTYMGLDFTFDHVTIHLSNAEQFASSLEEVTVKIEDNKFELDEEGKTEEIGPLNINGDLEVVVETDLPWGTFKSEKHPVDSSTIEIEAPFYDDDVFEDIQKTVGEIAEQITEAKIKGSKKPLKLFGKQPKDLIVSEFDNNETLTAKVLKYSIDQKTLKKADKKWYEMDTPNNVKAKMPSIVLTTHYFTKEEEESYVSGGDPIPYELTYKWEIGLTYDKERDNNWYAEVLVPQSHLWFDGFDPTDTWDGAGELYSASGKEAKKEKKSKDKDLEKEMESFMKDYTDKSVEAINERDFSLVSDYISSDGPRYDEARDYIDYLESEDVYETWLGSELEEMKELGDDEWEVTMIEKFDIIWPDETKTEEFRTTLIVKRVDGDFLVYELTETNST